MSEKKKRKFSGRKLSFWLLIAIFSATFIVSAAYLGNYYLQSQQAGQQYDDLAHMLEDLRATAPTDTLETAPKGEKTILPEYQPIYDMNNHTAGWITVADTKINYPVMHTPGRPDYYLKRNFNHQWSDWGAIYAREDCDLSAPSDNITLFGHHMKDGSMFAGLDKFKKESFWKDHQTFTFDTLYEHHTYQIWAVFKTSAVPGKGFAYHTFVDAKDEADFNKFVSTIKGMSFYETGLTPQYGDKLLCLSTCEYSLEDGRFVVCAVRIS